MTKARYIPLAVAAAIMAGGAGTALAQNAGQNDASELAALQGAKVSLNEAIGIAEKEAGGKAVGAGIEDENGQYAYEVEVLGANGEQEVLIDPATGKVTKMARADDEQATEDREDGAENGEDND